VAYSGSSTPRFGDSGSGTLRLLVYLAIGVALMVSDHRGGVLARVRQGVTVAVEPVWWLASLPARFVAFTQAAVSNQTQLNRENVELQQQLLLAKVRIQRLQSLAAPRQKQTRAMNQFERMKSSFSMTVLSSNRRLGPAERISTPVSEK